MALAMARGQVTTEGAVMKVLKLVPGTKFLFPIYIDARNAAVREDLLV